MFPSTVSGEQQGNRGITTRAPAVALAVIDSSDAEQFDRTTGLRINSANPSRVFINNQESVLFGYMTRVALTEICIQYSIPNVNSYNNTMTIGMYDLSGVYQSAVRLRIPIRFYTGPGLGNTLARLLNTNAELTAFFGPNTFSVSINGLVCGGNAPVLPAFFGTTQVSSDGSFIIETTSELGRFAVMPCNSTITGLAKLDDDVTNMMGITPTQTSNDSYIQLQGGYSSMQYTAYVDVTSTQLTRNQVIRDGSSRKGGIGSSLLARVYFANEDFLKREYSITYDAEGIFVDSTDNAIGTAEGVFRREFSYPKQIQWNNTENIDIIDIQVLDSKGRPLFYQPSGVAIQTAQGPVVQIQNTADIYITIQATEN